MISFSCIRFGTKCAKDYAMIKSEKLKQKIEGCGYTIKKFSSMMNISCSAFQKRMSGSIDFKLSEISRIIELLSIPKQEVEDYFFNYEVAILETLD